MQTEEYAMEIEKKFQIAQADDFAQLLRLTRLGRYDLRQIEAEAQENTYYDTADQRLGRCGYGLRIRAVAGHCVATLKGPAEQDGSRPAEAGLFRRSEWEVEAQSPDPATWPTGPARSQATALLEGAPLLPLLTIATRRRRLLALQEGQAVAELALDESKIAAGDRTEQFCELEIELLPLGSPADLAALETALHAHLPLVPEHRSKLQRGLELFELDRSPTE